MTNGIAFKVLIKQQLRHMLRIPAQTLLPSVINAILFFIIFGGFIGRRVGQIHNMSYMQYIVPGLIMLSAITNAFSCAVFSFYIRRFHRSIEELLTAPISNVTILLGYVCGGMLRGIVTATLIWLVSLFFTPFHIAHPLIMLLSLFISTAIFACGGFINGQFAKSFEGTSLILTFFLTPLIYLGGVFYPVNELPDFWHHVSLFNPILYLVETFRYAFTGVSSININHSLLISIAILIAVFFTAWKFLQKGYRIKE